MEFEMSSEMSMDLHLTQIVDYLQRADNESGKQRFFSDFLDEIAEKIKKEREGKSSFERGAVYTLFIGGKPGRGKTNLAQQSAIFLTEKLGYTWTDLSQQPVSTEKESNIEVHFISWSDCIKAAIELKLIKPKPYGEWSHVDLIVISQVAVQALHFLKTGWSYFPKSNYKNTKILFVDVPLFAERGMNIAYHLFNQPNAAQRTYFVGTMTDVESQTRRLEARKEFLHLTNGSDSERAQKVTEWSKKQNVSLESGTEILSEIGRYLYLSCGTVHAATQITLEVLKTFLRLNDKNDLKIDQNIVEAVQKEITLIKAGHDLISPEVQELEKVTLGVVDLMMFKYLVKNFNIPENNYFIGENIDLPSVSAYYSLSLHHSLVANIVEWEQQQAIQAGGEWNTSILQPDFPFEIIP